MSTSSDSRVIDALHDSANLERVLEALGCDTRKDNGAPFESPHGFIHCPSPDHADNNPSVTVRADQGLVHCHSLCEDILPLDLIVAHGQARTRGEAAKWVEKLLGLEPGKAPKPKPMIDDPSMTVARYLAMKSLPAWIADRFALQDVETWHPGAEKGTRDCNYESGWYDSVLMPTRKGRRARVRSDWPGAKLRWSGKAKFFGAPFAVATDLDELHRALELDIIGLDQMQPMPAGSPQILVVVEGESDVHAMHAMGLECVVGVPGSKMGTRLAAELTHACFKAAHGDTDLTSLTVVIWQEPGSAGAKFPTHVAGAIANELDQQGMRPPAFATLRHRDVATAPKDPATLLLHHELPAARDMLGTAILAALPNAGVAAEVEHSTVQVAPVPEVGHFGLENTSPPLTIAAPGDAPGHAETSVPAISSPEPPSWMDRSEPRVTSVGAQWAQFDEIEDAPDTDLAPEELRGIGCSFMRTMDGWSMEKFDKNGVFEKLVPICSPFVVEQVERCSGEQLVRVAAPFGDQWNRARLSMRDTADAGKAAAALAAIGVYVANRQRASVTDLLLALARRQEIVADVVDVPSGTGWAGRPGTSKFGGLEVEPVNDFGARMFQSNLRRRERRPDTLAAAREWWDGAVAPLLMNPDEEAASSVAPLLALGAAAAAPLVGPLAEVGVAVAPVVWIAGLGGGGKSVTQKVCASIFAPSAADLDGQSAFFANANISQAALSARVDSCRDLPLILDDVTQLPPLPGSTQRGDAARIEAAASLGMMVFNRKPIERATRDGGIRQTRAFRSTAIFSAEVSMSTDTVKSVVTAGHRRRISTIESQPMTERGLTPAYAEQVNHLSATVGGAAGDLLVGVVRDVVTDRELRNMYDRCRTRVAAMPEGADVTSTQVQSLAVNMLGYALLAFAVNDTALDDSIDEFVNYLRAYLSTGAGAGGATRDSDLSGIEGALRAIEDLMASHPARFDDDRFEDSGILSPVPHAGYLGKVIRPMIDGTRRVVMLRAGMEMLAARSGVVSAVIEQAVSEGAAKKSHQARMSDGKIVRGVLWKLPPVVPEDDDPDPNEPAPHDPDPHNLADPDPEPTVPDYVPPTPLEPGSWTTADLRSGAAIVCNTCGEVFASSDDVTGTKCQQDGCDGYLTRKAAADRADLIEQPAEPAPWDDAQLMQSPQGITLVWLGRPVDVSPLEWLETCIANGRERGITHLEGDYIMDLRYHYGTGLYHVSDEGMVGNLSLHKTIRNDVEEEFAALIAAYKAAAEAAPSLAVEVGPMLPEGDPRWSAIDGLGQLAARGQWALANNALVDANAADNEDAKLAAYTRHVKAYRFHLMSRHRHPEWFIEVTDA